MQMLTADRLRSKILICPIIQQLQIIVLAENNILGFRYATVATLKQSLKTFFFKLAYRLWDSFCFKMFLIYIVDNLGYIWIILYIVDIL